MKIKVTKEQFNRNFYPGSCKVCAHYNEKTESCTIDETAKFETHNFEHKYDFDNDDSGKMDCVCWEYKYTTE